jgi:hypothetical protein
MEQATPSLVWRIVQATRQWVMFWRYRPWLKCENVCGWTWPYGYVPECGCPVHDPDE